MDLDDLDKPTQQPARTSRFAPKSRLKKPPSKSTQAPKPEPTPESEPMEVDAPPAVLAVKKEIEEVRSQSVDEMDVGVAEKVGGDVVVEKGSDDVAVTEDYVVAEYDVYYATPVSDSQLYVMQYPLRPSWRPYELDQHCTEVRMRPTIPEVEVDMSIEKETEYYNPDAPQAGLMKKQTIASSGRQPQVAAYAVGLLMGNKLYLNPIHAIMQFRPKMEFLDFVEVKKKSAPITVKEEGSIAGASKKQGNETDQQVVEPWIPLKYHSYTSDLAQTYLRKMATTEESNPLQFSMNPYDYLNSLCPGAVINKTKSNGLSKRSLLSLPLEERLKKLFVEGPHIQRFNAIKHIAPDDSVENVLKILQKHAHLVQGVWVAKSSDRCSKGPDMLVRDYALFLFSQSPIIKDKELDILRHRKSIAKTLIREIAIERQSCKDWKFKEATDLSFINQYKDVVEHQRNIWQENKNKILERLDGQRHGPKRPGSIAPSDGVLEKPTNEARSDEGLGRATNEARSVSFTMPQEARDALSKVLGKLFLTHKVCSLQTIREGLRSTALDIHKRHKDAGKSIAVVAAVQSIVDGPQEALQSIINDYAVNVHGLYLLKSSSENPDWNPLRNNIIEVFRGKDAGAKVKKSELVEAGKTTGFQKVINEYCVSSGGAWVLKSGYQVAQSDWQSFFKAAKLV